MFKSVFIKLKSLILPSLVCLFILCLLLFSKDNLVAAKSGLSLWANSVLPSLFPFFIATELLGYTNIVSILGKFLEKIMRPVFNVPGEGSFALIMGIISGYPVGAKIVSNLKEQKICSEIEAERLIAFTNNSGPLFIIGTVGISMFSSFSIGMKLFVAHVLACLTVGFLFRWWKKSYEKNKRNTTLSYEKSTLNLDNLGEILQKSILSSINTILIIGGFVVLFSIIISILNSSQIIYIISNFLKLFLGIPNKFFTSIITGFIEVTNGISFICSLASESITFKLVLCSFVIGFGGFSVLLQVLSITSKSEISIKPYFIGKLLQGIFAAIYVSFLI